MGSRRSGGNDEQQPTEMASAVPRPDDEAGHTSEDFVNEETAPEAVSPSNPDGRSSSEERTVFQTAPERAGDVKDKTDKSVESTVIANEQVVARPGLTRNSKAGTDDEKTNMLPSTGPGTLGSAPVVTNEFGEEEAGTLGIGRRAPGASKSGRSASLTERPGEPFGRFRLLAVFGSAPHTELHLASEQQDSGSNRACVVKRLAAEHACDDYLRSLFEEESRAGGRLRHPNIVTQLGSGEIEGVPYIALEFVDGMSLRHLDDLAAPDRLPLSIAVEIVNRIARALSHAHRARRADGTRMKLVHRNVCPESILLSRSGEVKLADFSVAEFAGRTVDTSVAAVRGNKRYMAPEHAGRRRVDARTDLFSLGVVLAELVTGEVAFPMGVAAEADPSVRVKKLVRAVTDLPGEVRSIIESMTAVDPDERPASSAIVAADLRRIGGDLNSGIGVADYLARTIVGHVPSVGDSSFGAFVSGIGPPEDEPEADDTPLPRQPTLPEGDDDEQPAAGIYPTTVGVLLRDVAARSGRRTWDKPAAKSSTSAQSPDITAPTRNATFVKNVASAIFQVYGEVKPSKVAPRGARPHPQSAKISANRASQQIKDRLSAAPRTFEVREHKASGLGHYVAGFFIVGVLVTTLIWLMLSKM